MEVAVLLLLTLPLSNTTPLRPVPRTSEVVRSKVTQAQGHGPELTIIPLHSEDLNRNQNLDLHLAQNQNLDLHLAQNQNLDLHLAQNLDLHLAQNLDLDLDLEDRPRPRRAPQRGCQLGTCQMHNLASTLYQMGRTSGKDESKRAHDPQGYGR